MDKSAEAFRTISEVADHLDTPAHVLRFWESRFPQIKPVKRAGGRRYYRPSDVALLAGIRRLLHDEGMTIRGVQKVLREQGVRHVAGLTEDDGPDAFDAVAAAQASSREPASAQVFDLTDRVREPAQIAVPDDADTVPLADDEDIAVGDQAADEDPVIRAGTTASDLPFDDAEVAGHDIVAADADLSFDDAAAELSSDAALGSDLTQDAPEPAQYDTPDSPALQDDAAPSGQPFDLFDTAPPPAWSPDQADVWPPSRGAETPEPEAGGTENWLPTVLRGLDAEGLIARQDRLRPLHARLLALRERMVGAARPGAR